MKKELSQLTDKELLDAAKKARTMSIIDAVLIGFLAGVIFYSVVKSSWGLLTLIPLYFAYRLINNSKYNTKELEQLLKERNLK